MRTSVRFWFGMIGLALMTACEDPIDLNLGNRSSELVIISKFTPGQPVVVQVSKTRSPFEVESDTLYLDNATVELYQGDRRLEVLERVPGSANTATYYITRQTTPSVGTQYTIRAQAPDFAAVSATSSVPSSTSIRSLEFFNLAVLPGEAGKLSYQYEVSLAFTDPALEKNFYHLNFYQQILEYRVFNEDTVLVGQRLERIRFTSELNDNSLIAYFEGGVLFDDQKINGRSVSYSFPLLVHIDPQQEVVGKMFAELRTVSEEYFLFHNSLSRQQTDNDGPFNDPVFIYDNIENGQGIFAGYNAAVDSVAIRF